MTNAIPAYEMQYRRGIVRRWGGREFIGEAVTFDDGRPVAGGSWLSDGTAGANWAIRDSQLGVMHAQGGLAVVGASQSSDNLLVPTSASAIGVAGISIANSIISRSAWGGYFDMQYESGPYGYGVEIAVKNKGTNQTSTPYFPTTGTYGVWLNTGDPTYGGAPVNASNTAIAVGKGGGLGWNRGIVFFSDGLTRDGFNRGRAISLAKDHHISWYDDGNNEAFYINCRVATAGKGSSLIMTDDMIRFQNSSGSGLLSIVILASNKATLVVSLPTSSAGLTSGQWWNNAGVPNIVS